MTPARSKRLRIALLFLGLGLCVSARILLTDFTPALSLASHNPSLGADGRVTILHPSLASGDFAYVALLAKCQRPATIPFPTDNTYSPERVRLGKALFFEPRLSGSHWISCATCHNPALSWGDGLPRGIGHGMGTLGRRTPTILNVAFGDLMFWDGRADSLEAQALGPIKSKGEMNQDLDGMIMTLQAIPGYARLFEAAYPGEGISTKTVAKAIATFERTIISGPAPFDRWVNGDVTAVSESTKRGFFLFNGQAACVKCHTGWNFTDDAFHDIGVNDADIGRAKIMPKLRSMQHAFKTPTLRNTDRRAPYLHNGSEQTLADVIEFYDRGGDAKRASLAPEIVPLHLTSRDKRDLVAFLKTLTGEDTPLELPVLPSSSGR
jgi:cytochrome c peroxidase